MHGTHTEWQFLYEIYRQKCLPGNYIKLNSATVCRHDKDVDNAVGIINYFW